MRFWVLLSAALLAFAGGAQATETVRVGALAFGTVNWELDAVKRHGLDAKHGFTLEARPVAGKQAAHIVFQSGEVDVIVSDWLWASRERARGKDYSFIPYSAAYGAVVARDGVADFKALKGKRLGVAGGPTDKSWLLLRAWAIDRHGFDPAEAMDVRYAAPPLLNGQIEHGKLDAVLNYWHYVARLEAQGYRRVVEVSEVLSALGADPGVPMVGYLFRESWAKRHAGIVARFNAALREARALLAARDAEWVQVRPLMRADDEATFRVLRERFRAGIPRRWGTAEKDGAARLVGTLVKLGGPELNGGNDRLSAGVFWPLDY